jgi:2-C-methyl-D-erythritol 4-phosphate cytidylyltransferase
VIWAVVPAAGVGARMNADRPKQYLPLATSTVIQQSIERLLSLDVIEKVVVATALDDPWWPALAWSAPERIQQVEGGRERSDSVLSALEWLSQRAEDDDWVLVHDAARPCLTHQDLSQLVRTLVEHPVGGILATPVTDTIKRAGVEQEIIETVERTVLWRALTPQLFRLGMLRDALQQCRKDGSVVTDDAQAIERAGFRPQLVEGSATNLKVTQAGDLILAEEILQRSRAQ